MESILIKGGQLVLALALLVTIHEFGHYVMARIFGIKVEKFYMFFNPWFSLVKWTPKKKKIKYDKNGNEKASWRDTEYGIGWLPLGGYVKIAGMVDESLDKEQLALPPKPYEFRVKPAYQRLCVMIGGVLFNFILAILIYAGIAWYWGDKYIPIDKAVEGMDYSTEAQAYGFRNGDVPLMINGESIDSSKSDILFELANAKSVTVLRNHTDTVTLDLPNDFMLKLGKEMFMSYRVPVYVDKVTGGEAAAKAGLQHGDHIVAIDTVDTPTFPMLTEALTAFAGKETTVTIERDGEKLVMPVKPSDGGKLGFQLMNITDIYPTVMVKYGFFESFPKGIELGCTTMANYVSSLRHLFTVEGAQSIGGFGAIGNMYPDKWDWYSFWNITAFLSIILAFMNILPIPGLDGGHVLFVLYELITRRKPSEKVLIYAQYVGMAFLLLLLVYANGADIVRALK
ncbi:MAG: RIP metalloprotease RseP [Paramuribaculum sp.]|nr:RIP metalloprotease RseP [Paramuribaculum sp.]